MFEQMKSAAISVMVGGALVVAATPVVTFEAYAADKAAASKKAEDCGKQFKKGSKEYKACMAPAKKGAKKMEKKQ